MRSTSVVAVLLSSTALVSANPVDAAANSKNAILERAMAKRDNWDDYYLQMCYNKLSGACSATSSTEACYQGSCSSECADHDPWSRSCCSESGGDLTALYNCVERKAREYNATATSKFDTSATFTPTASENIPPPTAFAQKTTDRVVASEVSAASSASAASESAARASAAATAAATAKVTGATTTGKPATAAVTGANTTSPNAGERLGSGGAVQLGMAGSAFAWGLSLLLL